MNKEKSCKERWHENKEDRINDLRVLFWHDHGEDQEDEEGNEIGNFYDYGLCFDYVAKGTFEDQEEGYFRYQLSWGGPSDEFRFYTDTAGGVGEITYTFLDWFDGHEEAILGEDYDLLNDIFEDFKDIGVVESELEKALEE